MGIYDRTLLIIGHPVPPKSSWWVQPDDAGFRRAWLKQFPRLTSEALAPGVEHALQQKEREAKQR